MKAIRIFRHEYSNVLVHNLFKKRGLSMSAGRLFSIICAFLFTSTISQARLNPVIDTQANKPTDKNATMACFNKAKNMDDIQGCLDEDDRLFSDVFKSIFNEYKQAKSTLGTCVDKASTPKAEARCLRLYGFLFEKFGIDTALFDAERSDCFRAANNAADRAECVRVHGNLMDKKFKDIHAAEAFKEQPAYQNISTGNDNLYSAG